jgi:hypothetical protein
MSAVITIIELEPLALAFAPAAPTRHLSMSKRGISRLIATARLSGKASPHTLVDVVSLKAYCERAPRKTDHLPIVFDRRAHAYCGRSAESIIDD